MSLETVPPVIDPLDPFGNVGDGTLERAVDLVEVDDMGVVIEPEEDLEEESEGETETAEAAPEVDPDEPVATDGEEATKAAEEGASESPWVMKLRVHHKDVEFDPYDDVDKTRELLQKGMAYDEKHGVNQAVERAEKETRSAVVKELINAGVLHVEPVSGALKMNPVVSQALAGGSPSEHRSRPTTAEGDAGPTTAPVEDAKFEELRARAYQSAAAMEEYLEARDARTRSATLADLRKESRQEQEQRQRSENNKQAHAETEAYFRNGLKRDVAFIRDAVTGKVDEEFANLVVESAKRVTLAEGADAGVKEYQRLLRMNLARNRRAFDALKRGRAKPSPTPSSTGKPSRSTAPGGAGSPTRIDPRHPFAHIRHD